MTCDRCGKNTNHIYITEDHEKVCKRSCNGDANNSARFFYARPKNFTKSSKNIPLSSSSFQKVSCWQIERIQPGNRQVQDLVLPALFPIKPLGKLWPQGHFFTTSLSSSPYTIEPTAFYRYSYSILGSFPGSHFKTFRGAIFESFAEKRSAMRCAKIVTVWGR